MHFKFYKAILKILFAALCTFLMVPGVQAKEKYKGTFIYIPLDDRPVTYSYPVKNLQAAGYEILTPPEKYLASADRTGDPDRLWQWLVENAPDADAAVISSDALIYGGLVASRTHFFDETTLQARVQRLEMLRERLPMPLYVYSTLMRTPRACYGNVEPPYYSKIGPAIFRYSELLDKEDTTGLTLRETLAKQAIKNNLPQADLNDWLQRRLKNYHVNKSLTELTAKYRFHYLAIGKDDNAPLSATHMEARYIKRDAFALSDQIFQIIPGVDQLGMLLLTRAVNEKNREHPLVYTYYAEGTGRTTIPQYSDSTLGESVPEQILVADARPTVNAAEADFILAVNTPKDGVMMDSTAPSNQFFASPRDKKYIGELEKFLNSGTRVSLADVTYSNGADNGFMNEFANRGNLEKLTAYNGWNTADNTIGFAIAQGILAPQISAEDNALLMRLRLVDDWFYQSNARRDATDFLERSGSSEEVYKLGSSKKHVSALAQDVCDELARKYPFTEDFKFKVGFPWDRLFEISVTPTGRKK